MFNPENILNEEILKFNMNFASMFVMYYECLRTYITEQLRLFYTEEIWLDKETDEVRCSESYKYKKEVRSLDSKIDNASLKWFVKSGAITEEDYNSYQQIRKRRNDLTHSLLRNLNDGFTDKDLELFEKLMELYRKIDNWWINKTEIPISADEIPDGYIREDVIGGEAMMLSAINEIVLGNGKEKYRKVLDELLKDK